MAATMIMTLTEFNRRRSEAVRAARQGTDVVIRPSRDDGDALVLTRLSGRPSAVARGIADGSIAAPTVVSREPFVAAAVDRDEAARLIADFEAGRL